MKKSEEVKNTSFLEQHDKLIECYREYESSIRVKNVVNKVSYVSPVNFSESMKTPRHRWFPYKEGFSPSFVKTFIDKYIPIEKAGVIVDPFSGVGTTPLVASELGRAAHGMDVSPLSTFVAKTKALNFTKDELGNARKILNAFGKNELNEISPEPNNETVVKYYSADYLEAMLSIKSFAESIEDAKVRDLFLLAYLSIVEDFSTHRKAGNGVKRKTKRNYGNSDLTPKEEVRKKIESILRGYLDDIESFCLKSFPTYKMASCLDEKSYSEISQISGVFTSPPYANCFDYSKIYMRELWLGNFFTSKGDQKAFRDNSLRSHVHSTWEERHMCYANSLTESLIKPILEDQPLWSKKIPTMLSGYFKDISRVLDLISRKSACGTKVGFVVSNSFYGGIPVATDLLIGQCAEKFGFKVISIDVYRGMIPSSQQYNKIEDKYFMRESLVILEKL
ncbi:hypothetical protein RJ44_19895 [Alteromonas macleodii]|uniref:hypothetical protein n=1 Tax=Alteromonas macleodii TaxID=28108 RepID=UPI00057FE0B9|nr:hypothetical protein [Alteromonas macleodii]KHT53263.1 hypothetical protein RJ44_19895 [Alteromonas macleodii]